MATQYDPTEEELNDQGPQTPQWYILKCQVNRETRVKKELERRIKLGGLENFVEEVYVPVETVIEHRKDGKQRKVEIKLYPGYIMVKMVLNKDTWFLMRETNGVGDFAGTSGKPMPARQEEVDRLLSYRNQSDFKPRVRVPYVLGDRVKITEGSFKDTEGEVIAIDDVACNVTVNVMMFGKDTPVTLEFNQTEKVEIGAEG